MNGVGSRCVTCTSAARTPRRARPPSARSRSGATASGRWTSLKFETTRGGTWRICCVCDYATKYVLAAHVSATAKARDAVWALRLAITRAEELLCHPLSGDCVDLESGELTRLRVVTDNGAAFKSDAFWRFIESQPHLEHIRTRHYAPNTNGVVERFHRSLKYEHLYQREIANAAELAEEVADYLQLFNEIRPHESLGWRRPHGVHRGLTSIPGESVQKA